MASLLSACQLINPQPPAPVTTASNPAQGGLINRTIAAPTPQAAGTGMTATVKRGTLRETIVLTGQISPARTSQLSFRSSGTVRAVYVRSGEVVQRGASLVELGLDEPALQVARNQATLAELAYQSQQARVEDLKRGVSPAAAEEARAALAKARATLIEAELARDAAGGRPGNADIQVARLALEQANDDLAQAQQAARSSRDNEDNSTAAALRGADRRVEEAAIKLEQLRVGQAAREQDRQRLQGNIDQARDELGRAQLSARRAEEDAQALRADGDAPVRAAERQVVAATIKLDLAQQAEETSTSGRNADRQAARLAMNSALADLAQAQSALRVNRELQGQNLAAFANVAPQILSNATPTPIALPTAVLLGAPLAPARNTGITDLRSAEAAVFAAARHLAEVEKGPSSEQRFAVSADRQLAQLSLEAANEELARARVAVQRTAEDSQAGLAGTASAVRAAERRLADVSLQLEQFDRGAPNAANELRLAELAVAQAEDDRTQAQTVAQQAAQRNQEATQSSARAMAFAVRSAERRLAESSLKLDQARANDDAAVANNQAQRQIPDLQVAAARAALTAAEVKLREAQDGAPARALQAEEQRAALLLDELVTARAMAQPVVLLTAPFDGTVTSVDASVGQIVEPRTTVLRLDDPGRLTALATAPESDVSRLGVDQPVEVTFPGVTTESARGSISDVGAVANRQGDRPVFPVRVDLDRVPAAVRLGMTATISYNAREVDSALSVPLTAVRTVGGRMSVTRVTPDGRIEDVPVVTGGTFASDVEIVSGLGEGDVVAVQLQAPAQMAAAGTLR